MAKKKNDTKKNDQKKMCREKRSKNMEKKHNTSGKKKTNIVTISSSIINDKDLDSIGILVRTNKDAEEISKNPRFFLYI